MRTEITLFLLKMKFMCAYLELHLELRICAVKTKHRFHIKGKSVFISSFKSNTLMYVYNLFLYVLSLAAFALPQQS